jgi:hypothetical protein
MSLPTGDTTKGDATGALTKTNRSATAGMGGNTTMIVACTDTGADGILKRLSQMAYLRQRIFSAITDYSSSDIYGLMSLSTGDSTNDNTYDLTMSTGSAATATCTILLIINNIKH